MYLNTIQIIGFVGKNPEQRQTKGTNAAYTVFSVTTQRSWKNAAGEWQKRTEWHRVVAWMSSISYVRTTCICHFPLLTLDPARLSIAPVQTK